MISSSPFVTEGPSGGAEPGEQVREEEEETARESVNLSDQSAAHAENQATLAAAATDTEFSRFYCFPTSIVLNDVI